MTRSARLSTALPPLRMAGRGAQDGTQQGEENRLTGG